MISDFARLDEEMLLGRARELLAQQTPDTGNLWETLQHIGALRHYVDELAAALERRRDADIQRVVSERGRPMSYRRRHESGGLEVEGSTAGASGGRDHGPVVFCSTKVSGPCEEVAREVLLVRSAYGSWEAYPRCPRHPACDYEWLVRKMNASVETLIVELP